MICLGMFYELVVIPRPQERASSLWARIQWTWQSLPIWLFNGWNGLLAWWFCSVGWWPWDASPTLTTAWRFPANTTGISFKRAFSRFVRHTSSRWHYIPGVVVWWQQSCCAHNCMACNWKSTVLYSFCNGKQLLLSGLHTGNSYIHLYSRIAVKAAYLVSGHQQQSCGIMWWRGKR